MALLVPEIRNPLAEFLPRKGAVFFVRNHSGRPLSIGPMAGSCIFITMMMRGSCLVAESFMGKRRRARCISSARFKSRSSLTTRRLNLLRRLKRACERGCQARANSQGEGKAFLRGLWECVSGGGFRARPAADTEPGAASEPFSLSSLTIGNFARLWILGVTWETRE